MDPCHRQAQGEYVGLLLRSMHRDGIAIDTPHSNDAALCTLERTDSFVPFSFGVYDGFEQAPAVSTRRRVSNRCTTGACAWFALRAEYPQPLRCSAY